MAPVTPAELQKSRWIEGLEVFRREPFTERHVGSRFLSEYELREVSVQQFRFGR
jgi:hypothetical protein